MSEFTPSRRSVVRTAAWSLPVVSLAAAAPAFAGSPGTPAVPTYKTVTTAFVFEANTAIGKKNIDVVVTAKIPATAPVGSTLLPIETSSTVTLPDDLRGALRFFYLSNSTHVKGTSASVSTLSGALGTFNTTTPLTIPVTRMDQTGPLVTIASGNGSPLSIPGSATPGTVTITIGAPESILQGCNAAGVNNGSPYNSVLAKLDGNSYVLGTFQVVPEFV